MQCICVLLVADAGIGNFCLLCVTNGSCLYRPRLSPAPLPICLSYVSACLFCPSDLCLGVLNKVRGLSCTSNVCTPSAEMPHETRMRMKEGSGDPTPAKRTVPRSCLSLFLSLATPSFSFTCLSVSVRKLRNEDNIAGKGISPP
jgi:hypothetical protein